jgi:two-component system CheB/CheR fusion protein
MAECPGAVEPVWWIMSASGNAEQLIAYVQHPYQEPANSCTEPESINRLHKILMIIRTRTGHDFFFYKESTILRRIERRMAVNEISNMADYIRYLQQYPDEVDTLFTELLIGVTNFFRDPEAFDALKGSDGPPRQGQGRRRPTPSMGPWMFDRRGSVFTGYAL